MPKVYGCIRVSTLEQINGMEAQRDAVRKEWEYRLKGKADPDGQPYEWAKAPDGGEFWEDRGVSGTTPFPNRPVGGKLYLQLQKGDVVIFSKLDRAFRDTRDAMNCLNEFTRRGVWLVLGDLGIDTRTILGKMFLTFLVAVAEFELARRRERQLEANAARRARGERTCPMPRYGFKNSRGPNGKRIEIPDPYTRACAQLFLEWEKKEGLSVERIWARALKCRVLMRNKHEWSSSSISRAMDAELTLQKWECENQPTCPQSEIDKKKLNVVPEWRRCYLQE